MASLSIKREFIKDPVWGNIELFSWEKALLNHHLFNRLHHVVQNSSGYRVYPGLRHSRFLHSIGVLHVVTQIYCNAIKNTTDNHALDQFAYETEAIERLISSEEKTFLDNYAYRFGIQDNYFYSLCVLRMGALLHDIGHLPYSHVFENAIEAFITNDELFTDSEPDQAIQALRNSLRGILFPTGENTSKRKIHEILGGKICLILELELQRVNPILSRLTQIARIVLHEGNFPLFKSLLSGDVDADRIDFVKRDGYFSGLYTSSVDYGRLFSSYEFAKHDGRFLSRPSLRAASEAEKLIFERFQFYKYVPSHHRVHLFDEILIRIVDFLVVNGELRDFFQKLEVFLRLPASEILNPTQRPSQRRRISDVGDFLRFTFNDSWLDSIIKQFYEKALHNEEAYSKFITCYEATNEDRAIFKSLHKGEGDAHSKLRINDCNTFLFNCSLSKHKFALETFLLSSFGQELKTVIVGDIVHRLSTGLENERMAAFLGLIHLQEFLEKKHAATVPFNVWFEISSQWRDEHLNSCSSEEQFEKISLLKRKIARICVDYIHTAGDIEMTETTGQTPLIFA